MRGSSCGRSSSLQGELGVHARGLTGTVRVLSNTAAFSEHLPKLLASFLARNPAISVDLEERESSDIGQLIASGSATSASPPRPRCRMRWRPCRSAAIASSPSSAAADALARRRQIRFGGLVERTFVGLPHAQRPAAPPRAACARCKERRLKVRVRVSGFDAVCRMVEAGVGIGIVPEVASRRRCRRSMRIAIVPLAEAWAMRRLVLRVGVLEPGR